MSNHFRLVLETLQANLVAGMKWFPGAFTSRFNRKHKLFGHLFSGRYKALIEKGVAHWARGQEAKCYRSQLFLLLRCVVQTV